MSAQPQPRATQSQQRTRVTHLDDGSGNRLIVRDGAVWLDLVKFRKHGKRPKFLGRFGGYNGRTLVVQREQKHYFRAKGGWGFNYKLFTNAEEKFLFNEMDFTGVTNTGLVVQRLVKVKAMLAAFDALKFSKSGYELQGFLDESFFGYKPTAAKPAPKKKPEPPPQGSLF